MQIRKKKGLPRRLITLVLCALLCAGTVSAFAATGGSSIYVNFDANGGDGWMGTVYADQNGSWIQPDSEFTYSGHAFIGWSTSPDGPVQYQPGDEAYADDPGMPEDNDPWMYAIWGPMSEEQLAGLYTPSVREPDSYDLSAARDDETGIVYLTAELSWNKSDNIDAVTVGLNLGSPDGPCVPSLATSFTKEDGSITRSYWYDEATVAIPYVADGEEQVITDGAVNGILPGDVIYATVAGCFGDYSCPGNPICFVTKSYSSGETVEDDVGWFTESGCATVTRIDGSTTISLLDDAVLPEGGIRLGNGSYHIIMNARALTGTLTNGRGSELYIEHLTADGKVLAAYAWNQQTVTFSGYGYSSGNLFGTVTATLKDYANFYYDSTYMTAAVTNGALIGTTDVQTWGYAYTASLDEYEKAPLTEDELATYTPKNVTVTPQEDGLIVECDYEPEATQININVDVILSDGSYARLISDSSSSSSKDQVMSLEGQRQPFFIGSLRRLSDQEEQEITENGEQKYVNGFHGGDRLSVTMNFKIGAQEQETPWSSPPVTFTYSSSAIGETFTQGGGTVARNFLPTVATLTVASPLDVTYMGEPVFLDYTLALNDGTPLELGVDYTEEYINNYGIGQATLAVIGQGDYSGRMTQPFTISAISLEDVDVTLATTSVVYDGSSQTPAVLVSYDGMILSKSSGYYAEYENNVNAGTATVTLTPGYEDICTGTRVLEFTIEPRSMESGVVYATLSQNRFEWTGADGTYEPEVTTAKWGETALTEGTDYSVSYEGNTAAGTAYAVLTGLNNYDGTYRIPFTIFQPVDLATAATIDPIAPEIYTRYALEPAVTVRVGDQILTEGWDYSVAYSNNVNAGEATVTVTGRRDYTGQTTATFVIDPADLGLLEEQGLLTMTLSKSEYPYGDAVYTFSGGENIPKATLTIIDPEDSWNNVTLYEGTSYTLSFENNIEAGTATAIAAGMGNYGGMCTTEFTINPLDLNDLYSASVASVTYNGQAQTPAISMYTTYLDENRYTQNYYLTEGVDYTIDSWVNNVNAGTVTGYSNGSPNVTQEATVTVTGTGRNFTGTRDIDFAIMPLQVDFYDEFELIYDHAVIYTGSPVSPEFRVTWKLDGRRLVEGTDFTVRYDDNLGSDGHNHTDVNDGISAWLLFQGNFQGSKETQFAIVNPSSAPPVNGSWWRLDEAGTLEVYPGGAMPFLGYSATAEWRPWSAYIQKIVVTNCSSISDGAFDMCPNVTEVVLPEGLTTIGHGAFDECLSLTRINIPSTVTDMGSYWPDVPGLVIHIPDGLTSGQFHDYYYTKMMLNPGSTAEQSLRGTYEGFYCYEGYPDFVLYESPNNPEYGLWLYRYTGSGGVVTIPGFIDYAYGYGMSDNNLIEKIVIPGTVSKLGYFQNDANLREIVIEPGNKLSELPNQFISGCNNITIYIPDNITTISVLNYYTDNNMLIVASCDSYAIEWAKSQMRWEYPVWSEEDGTTGPHYRLLHRNPTEHAGKDATCTEDGWTPYITCTTCDYNNKVDIPALGHSWGAADYEWNNDHTSVTATRICSHDAGHVETETKTATAAVTTPATCISEGVRTYTSAVFENPAFRVQKMTETIPVTGHTWRAEPSTAADSGDGIRGSAVCGNCGEQKPERSVSAQKILRIPAMMSTIEAEAFMATAAEQINVPEGTVIIGDKAFANCDDLRLVVIPGEETVLEGDPFADSDVAVICPEGSAAAAWCDNHGIPHNP